MRLLNKSVVSPDDLRQAQRLILDYLDRPRREAEWRDDPRLPMAPSRR